MYVIYIIMYIIYTLYRYDSKSRHQFWKLIWSHFGLRSLKCFGLHPETGIICIRWNVVNPSLGLCFHHIWKVDLPTDFRAKKIPIQEAMEMYFQLMESYALDAGMALQCRRDPRLFFGKTWRHGSPRANSLSLTVHLAWLERCWSKKHWMSWEFHGYHHVKVAKTCILRGNAMGCWVCKSTKNHWISFSKRVNTSFVVWQKK